jgi:hypothetical protein
MEITTATKLYEQWLGGRLELIPDDLAHKHAEMTRAPQSFLRATFYRWAQQWSAACPDLARAPSVLSVGDLHVENFGTWRDQEGRLVWGVDDVDEAYPLPWPQDLVRLVASAQLSGELDPEVAAGAILEGYRACLDRGGRPFVLAEDNVWLRKVATSKMRSPERFWKKLDECPVWERAVPDDASAVLRHMLPETDFAWRVVHRVAGLGSLGRHRFVALGEWRGGRIAREAKALAPSAWAWATGHVEERATFGWRLHDTAVRVPDPYARTSGAWTVRRLSPDCARVELADVPEDHDAERLLGAMGWELGNLHLGTPGARDTVLADLAQRPKRWLPKAAARMRELVIADWKSWQRAMR